MWLIGLGFCVRGWGKVYDVAIPYFQATLTFGARLVFFPRFGLILLLLRALVRILPLLSPD